MNYIVLINNYWHLREQGILDRTAGDLYLYLIHKSNSLGWKNPFNQKNALICGFLGITEKTLIANRNRLKQVGLVDFLSGKKGVNTEYTLLAVVMGSSNYSESYSESYSHTGSESYSETGTNTPDNNKHKTKQNKRNKGGAPELSEGLENPKPKPPPVPPPPSKTPTLSEVEGFFRTAGGNKIMAGKFWNKYEGVGWKNGSMGTPILNWRSFANNFIANYLENEKKNGRKQTIGDSISAVNAATAELIREINEAAGNGGTD